MSSSSESRYFCTEPWTGMFTVQTNQDVTFCPCYLQMKIGNLGESSMQEIWNSPALIGLRGEFARGVLPEPCQHQTCPVAMGAEIHVQAAPHAAEPQLDPDQPSPPPSDT